MNQCREFSLPHFPQFIFFFQNLSALHIAVKEKNAAMVEILLSRRDIECGDAALHAIRDNDQKIAIMILDKLKSQSKSFEFSGAIDSSEFPDEMTPMDVAAICGHFEMIKILAARGHSIEQPHPPSCYCDEICKYNFTLSSMFFLYH